MENNELSFTIKEIAKLVGVSSATIRNWEKNELFIAKRNANNYRYFDLKDINLLKKIKSLSIDEHLNIATIKNMIYYEVMIPSSNTNQNEEDEDTFLKRDTKKLLNSKWKEYREKMGLTLEDVSQKTGISSSYLSRIERFDANISLNILEKLSSFYGESIIFFYENQESEAETYIIRKDKREPIDLGFPGVYIESLISDKNATMRTAIYTILPKSGSLQSHSHRGEEFVFVFSGELKITLRESDEFLLGSGDSISFKSMESHKWQNSGSKLTKILWVHSTIG